MGVWQRQRLGVGGGKSKKPGMKSKGKSLDLSFSQV